MNLRLAVSLAIFSLLGSRAFADEAGAERADFGKAGIGVRIKQAPEGVTVTQVYWGAKREGIRKHDVIVLVRELTNAGKNKKKGKRWEGDAVAVKDLQHAGELLVGDACTPVEVTVERDSKRLPPMKVWRIPIKNPGDCVGYYQFKTPSQRRLRTLGKELFSQWQTLGGGALAAAKKESEENSSLSLQDFLKMVNKDYKVDMTYLETHATEVLEHLRKTMPEGSAGKWKITKMNLRITNENVKGLQDAHIDDGDSILVLTTLLGKTTRFHPFGCLGSPEHSELRQSQPSKTLVIQGGSRFSAWGIGTRKERATTPVEIKAIATACTVDAKDKGRNMDKSTFKPVPHGAPADQRKRVLFIMNVTFKPDTAKK